MKTEDTSKAAEHAPSHGVPAPSPLRLIILLSVLVVVGGALLYDWVIAPPRVKAAYDKLHAEVLEYNESGLRPDVKNAKNPQAVTAAKPDGMLYSEDIQKILEMTPTKTEKSDLYTIEHYCWWGWIPRNRNYITVLYIGDPKKPHYSTHYANMMPEDGVIPGKQKDAPHVDLTLETTNAEVAIPTGAPAAATPPIPGAGAPGSGAKAKGRPKAASESKEQDAGAESPKKEESKAEAEPKKGATGDSEKKEPAKDAAKNEGGV